MKMRRSFMRKSIRIILSLVLVIALSLQLVAFTSVSIKDFSVDKSSVTLKVGETYNIKVTFTPAGTTQKLLTFASSNKNVASIDGAGKITATGAGKADITVTSSSKKSLSKKISVNVTQPLKPVTLKWYTYRDNKSPDDQLVLNEANKIIKSKINATLTMDSFSYGEYNQKMQLLLSSGDKFDLCFTAGWLLNYSENSARGAFEPLDALVAKYAPGTKKLIPQTIWNGAKTKDPNGKDTLFGVPNYQISYSQYGLMFRKDLVEKYKLQSKINAVKKQSDLTPIFEIIKKNEPNISVMKDGPWWAKEMSGENIVDGIESNWVVVCGKGYKVMDLTDPYLYNLLLADAALDYKWYSSGFYHKDYGLAKDLYPELQAGKFFCWGDTYKPGVEADLKTRFGFDVYAIPLGDPIISNGSIQNTLTAINKNSKNKERAMMLLELMNTDKKLYNTMSFGIEGKHYKKTGANRIQILPNEKEVRYKNSAWELGCQFNAFILPGQSDDVWEKTAKANATARTTPLNGIILDGTSFTTQQANMTPIVKEYTFGLSDDYEAQLKEMRDRLVKAGMSDMKKEFQRQIDELKKSGKLK
jgi:putative aldouronate transport system substrate-binding protein